MKKFLQNFIHCGLLGWCLEITFTAFDSFRKKDYRLSGATSIWMFPIYGLAALLSPVCRLLRNQNFILRGTVYASLIFAGEFITGMYLRRQECCPWNYEHSKWNLNSVIRLDYAPCWFFAGLLFEKLLRTNDESLRPD